MPFEINRASVWAGELQDHPGALAEALGGLQRAGVNLEFVILRPTAPMSHLGVLFVAPIAGTAQERAATAEATREGKDRVHYPDGAVVPACMEACPTGAITFGDANAPGSKVAALAAHPRAMRLLEALGVKPAISYLTKVRNDKA